MLEGIKAIGFDLDGTFLNTHVDYSRIDRADRNACISHDVPFDDLEFNTVKRLRAPIRDWLIAHGREEEFQQITNEIDRELTSTELQYIHEARPFPGSIECVKILKSEGYRIGLLTRGSHEYAVRALTMAGVLDCFDAVVGRDDMNYDDAKPSPKAMYHFADKLGVKADEILYLGDNRTDYYSARDSGARFIGVLSGGMSKEAWLAEDPDMTILEYAGDVIGLL